MRAGAFAGTPLFACAYGVVRGAHIALFLLASREDAALRHSVVGLAASTAVGVGLLVLAAFTHGALQLGIWGLALLLDAGGPLLFGAEGWSSCPGTSPSATGRSSSSPWGSRSWRSSRRHPERERRRGRGGGSWHGGRRSALVAVLRHRGDSCRTAALESEGGTRTQRDRPRLRLRPALPDARGNRPGGRGPEKDAWPCHDPLKLVAAAAMLGGVALYLLAHVAFRWAATSTGSTPSGCSARCCS